MFISNIVIENFRGFHESTNVELNEKLNILIGRGCRTKWESGKYLASHDVYGYRKSGEDKYKLAIDDVTAPVVRRIFNTAAVWK